MLLLGLVLVVLGILGFVLSFFGASIDYNHRSAEILNWDVAPRTLVLWGAISMLLTLVGLWMTKIGMRQSRRHRREQKRLAELSEKLDTVEQERGRHESRRDDADG